MEQVMLKVVCLGGDVCTRVVDSVTLPTNSNETIGILPGHAGILSLCEPGIVTFTADGVTERWGLLRGGVARVAKEQDFTLLEIYVSGRVSRLGDADLQVDSLIGEAEAIVSALVSAGLEEKAKKDTSAGFRTDLVRDLEMIAVKLNVLEVKEESVVVLGRPLNTLISSYKKGVF